MQRGLGGSVSEPAQEPVQPRRDKELTIGPAMLAAIGLGLFALGALCFVFGYSVGRRSTSESATVAAQPAHAAASPLQPAIAQSKPSAGQTGVQPEHPAATSQSDSSPSDSAPDSNPDSTSAPAPVAASLPASPGAATASPGLGAASSNSGKPSLHPDVTGQPAAAQPDSAGGAAVHPALGQSAGIMVQIAAVSEAEDADVLMSALRKRGYTVTSHRDPADGLLHVQVGPFANRADAYAMRQKLLNDGYNAVVE